MIIKVQIIILNKIIFIYLLIYSFFSLMRDISYFYLFLKLIFTTTNYNTKTSEVKLKRN